MEGQSIKSSLFWKLFERGSVQIIQFVVGIIIARLLAPSDYGSVALLTVFIAVATVFVQSGLGVALVQKKDSNKTDFSSVFWYSIIIACVSYLILFFSANGIATFYNNKELVVYLKVMALILFPGALSAVQIAYLSKHMLFRLQFRSSLIAASISGIIGITVAYMGFGAWALICQQILYQIVLCTVLFFLVPWRPSFVFSLKTTKPLLNYGSKILVSNLVDTLYRNMESLVIGKFFSAATLAFCNKGKVFPMVISDNIDGSVQSVMLPAFSKYQEDRDSLKVLLRKTISLSTFLFFPSMMLLAASSKPLIGICLGPNWMECVPYVMLFCALTLFFPMQTASVQALNAKGLSDVTLGYRVLTRIIGVSLLFLFLFVFRNPYFIVIASIVTEISGVIILLPSNKKYLNYGALDLAKDVFPPLVCSLCMFAVIFPLGFIISNYYLLLVIQLLLGASIYIGLAFVSKNTNLTYFVQLTRKYVEEKK